MAGEKHSFLSYLLQIFSYSHGHSQALSSRFGAFVDALLPGLSRSAFSAAFSAAHYGSSKFVHFACVFCSVWLFYCVYMFFHKLVFSFSREQCYITMRLMNSYVNYNIPIRLVLLTYLTLLVATFLNFTTVRPPSPSALGLQPL